MRREPPSTPVIACLTAKIIAVFRAPSQFVAQIQHVARLPSAALQKQQRKNTETSMRAERGRPARAAMQNGRDPPKKDAQRPTMHNVKEPRPSWQISRNAASSCLRQLREDYSDCNR